MRSNRSISVWLCVLTLTLPSTGRTAIGLIHDRSDLDLGNYADISIYTVVDDIVVSTPVRVTAAVVWLADSVINDNGVLDSFGGTLSWGIREDSSGVPGALLASGKAVAQTLTDSGLQNSTNADVVKVRFELETPLYLASGTYWFGLHEGAWGAPDDGSSLRWQNSFGTAGLTSVDGSERLASARGTGFGLYSSLALYGTTTTWNQGGIADLTSGSTIGAFVEAADMLVLSGTTRFSAVDVWLLDDEENDNGVLDTFGGTLGWAIYANSSGKPGTLLASGRDPAPALADTGLQSAASTDAVRARIRLGRAISLTTGTYWFALHEGNWGSAYDGSEVTWAFATASFGNSSWGDSNEVSPGSWGLGPDADPAFVVFEDPIFASGFEAGVTCAWSSGAGLVCP